VGGLSRILLKKISDRIRKIAEGKGNLSRRRESENDAAAARRLSIGFNRFGEKISEMLSKLAQTGGKISSASSVIMGETRDMAAEAEIQVKAVEAVSASIAQINTRSKDLTVFSEGLAETSRESSEALEQITEAFNESTRNTTTLSRSVEGTSTSISSMSLSIRDVDANVGILLKEVEVTSSSMAEMDRSLREMRANIRETVSLSEEARDNAERGKKTVALTVAGMDRIKAYANEVTQVIQNLQQKTERIGKFLSVIDDVAEQTNLLALNAAIIASKAGRHGKGFSIVSNEIKELSERTASSTHEIHAIINDLKSEGEIAVRTIEIGNKRIEEGVEFSKSAHKALRRIMEGFEHSTEQTGRVEKVIREQSSGVKRVMHLMTGVNDTVSQIAKATRGQNRVSEGMMESTDQIRRRAGELETVMKSESKWMEKVKEKVKDVSVQALKIANAASGQRRQSGDMIRVVGQIKKVTHTTESGIKKVRSAVEELKKETKALEGSIAGFKVESRDGFS